MDMNIPFLVEILRELEGESIGPNIREGSLSRFLHHFSKGTRQEEAFISFHFRSLDKDDISSILCPGQSCSHADAVSLLGDLPEKFPWAQEFFYGGLIDDLFWAISHCHLLGHFTTDGGDLPF